MSSCSTTHSCSHSHHTTPSTPVKRSLVLQIAVHVTRVALGILAFIAAPEFFVPAFTIGLAYGIYKGITAKNDSKTDGLHSVKECSTGMLELLMDEELTQIGSLLAGTLIFAYHVLPHPFPLAPMTGGAVGYWTGKEVVKTAKFVKEKMPYMREQCTNFFNGKRFKKI